MGSMYDWTDCVNRAATKYESTNLLFDEQINLINSLGEYARSLYTNAKRRYEEITWTWKVPESPDVDVERGERLGVTRRYRQPDAFINSDTQASFLDKIWRNTEVYAVLGRILYLIEALAQDLKDIKTDFGVYEDPVLEAQLNQVQALQEYDFVIELEKIYNAYKETIEEEARLCLEIRLITKIWKAASKLSKELIKKDREQAVAISENVLRQETFEKQKKTIAELAAFVTVKIQEYRNSGAVEKNPEKTQAREKALEDAIQSLERARNQWAL